MTKSEKEIAITQNIEIIKIASCKTKKISGYNHK